MTGTSYQHSPRGSMTPQRALRIFQARGGVCHCPANDIRPAYGCGRKLTPRDDWIVEHGIAFENGGTDADENCFIICDWCKPIKDADDHALAGHGRRMAAKHSVPKRFKRSKGWGR